MPNLFNLCSLFNLLFFILLNLITLGYLILRLSKLGNSISGSFRGAWILVVGSRILNRTYRVPTTLPWIWILKKSWWLMLGITIAYWVFSPGLSVSIILVGLVLFHFVWYWESSRERPGGFNQMIYLNTNWGIMFQEIDSGSNLNQRSLAELDLRKKNLLVLAVERRGQFFSFPKGVETLTVGDRVYIFGDLESYHAIITKEEPPPDPDQT